MREDEGVCRGAKECVEIVKEYVEGVKEGETIKDCMEG